MNLSASIKKIRQKTFMTQEEFANEMGVAFSTVNRWENGKTIPNPSAMKQMRDFCKKNKIPFEEVEDAWVRESGD